MKNDDWKKEAHDNIQKWVKELGYSAFVEVANAFTALRAEVEGLREDKARLDWLEADLQKGDDEGVCIEFRDGKFRFPYLVSNDGGFGGGVGEFHSSTLRSAIDAARASSLAGKEGK